jgi:hypothetical protein
MSNKQEERAFSILGGLVGVIGGTISSLFMHRDGLKPSDPSQFLALLVMLGFFLPVHIIRQENFKDGFLIGFACGYVAGFIIRLLPRL